MMPEWLLKDENYIPESDRDTFINRSILSLLKAISHIKARSGYKADGFYVHAAFKVAFTVMLVILLSISRSFTFIVVVNVYLLLVLSIMGADDIVRILKVSFATALFYTCYSFAGRAAGQYIQLRNDNLQGFCYYYRRKYSFALYRMEFHNKCP